MGGSVGDSHGSRGGYGAGGFGTGGGGASGYDTNVLENSKSSAGGGGGGSFANRSLHDDTNALVAPLIVGSSGESLPSVVITYEMQ